MSPVIYIGGTVGVVIDGLSQGLHTQCNLALDTGVRQCAQCYLHMRHCWGCDRWLVPGFAYTE